MYKSGNIVLILRMTPEAAEIKSHFCCLCVLFYLNVLVLLVENVKDQGRI